MITPSFCFVYHLSSCFLTRFIRPPWHKHKLSLATCHSTGLDGGLVLIGNELIWSWKGKIFENARACVGNCFSDLYWACLKWSSPIFFHGSHYAQEKKSLSRANETARPKVLLFFLLKLELERGLPQWKLCPFQGKNQATTDTFLFLELKSWQKLCIIFATLKRKDSPTQ